MKKQLLKTYTHEYIEALWIYNDLNKDLPNKLKIYSNSKIDDTLSCFKNINDLEKNINSIFDYDINYSKSDDYIVIKNNCLKSFDIDGIVDYLYQNIETLTRYFKKGLDSNNPYSDCFVNQFDGDMINIIK